MTIKEQARREAEAKYPTHNEEGLHCHRATVNRLREGYATATEHYLTQLAERDRVRSFTEEEVCVMLRDTLSAALKNRLALDSTSIRQEAERHIAEHYGLNIFNT